MRSITEREYKQLKQDKPWSPSMSYATWMDSIGARSECVTGRIVRGGKVHSLIAMVIERDGETLVIDAYQTCGSGRRGFQYHISLVDSGEKCGKCF